MDSEIIFELRGKPVILDYHLVRGMGIGVGDLILDSINLEAYKTDGSMLLLNGHERRILANVFGDEDSVLRKHLEHDRVALAFTERGAKDACDAFRVDGSRIKSMFDEYAKQKRLKSMELRQIVELLYERLERIEAKLDRVTGGKVE